MFMVVLCVFSSCSVYLDFVFECYGAALEFRCAKRYVCFLFIFQNEGWLVLMIFFECVYCVVFSVYGSLWLFFVVAVIFVC